MKFKEITYFNMTISISRDSDVPEVACVARYFRNKYGLTIGNASDNPILDTHIYELEYPYSHKASLAENSIVVNIFYQVYGEGNIHVLFEEIIDHINDGSEFKQKD